MLSRLERASSAAQELHSALSAADRTHKVPIYSSSFSFSFSSSLFPLPSSLVPRPSPLVALQDVVSRLNADLREATAERDEYKSAADTAKGDQKSLTTQLQHTIKDLT